MVVGVGVGVVVEERETMNEEINREEIEMTLIELELEFINME